METYMDRIFTGVAVVCRSRPPIAALSHVALNIDAYLDPTPSWTLPDACRFGSARLLDRIAARLDANGAAEGGKGGHEPQREFQSGVTRAMQLGHVAVVQWLVRRFPRGHVPSTAVAEAARNGHLSVLRWLFGHHDHVYWGGDEMYFAVANNHLELTKFLHEHTAPPPDDMFLSVYVLKSSHSASSR
ncbi:hypothetical protein PHYPSEUDO_008758 [Phytophthora pseudosyringae]|uniref:Uncharacterized protein n=1 Tax=Phytophthora pseudosyringae TaxID=221518 RepID=A0A8T1VIR6_9STRA|nr:hypothetical protein PHYPSEUDO_008758 [Phytophthora pseudosyringae]